MSFWSKIEARSQSNLYFALVFLDRKRRTAFRDVYRFLRAADDAADAPGPTGEVIGRLDVWRAELDALYAGRAQHPFARRLAASVERYGLSRAHFEAILDGLKRDVRTARWPDRAALESYCEAVASSLGYLCLELLGLSGAAALGYARDVGIALQLANILRDVAEDAAVGRIYLPAADLAAAGAAEADLLAGRWSPAHAEVARALAGRARALIAQARRRLDPALARSLLVPEIWADVYLALLDELEAIDFDVVHRRPYLRRRRKLRLALRRAFWAPRTVVVG